MSQVQILTSRCSVIDQFIVTDYQSISRKESSKENRSDAFSIGVCLERKVKSTLRMREDIF